MNNRIYNIDAKLSKLEQQAQGASEGMKKWLRIGYRLLLDEKKRLLKSAEKKESNQDSLIQLTNSY